MTKIYLINALNEAIVQLQSAKAILEENREGFSYRLNEGVGLANYARRLARHLNLMDSVEK